MKFYLIVRITEGSQVQTSVSEIEFFHYFEEHPIASNEIVCIKVQ